MNQKLLRGVGNIYADEALFRAGIRPRRRVSTIPGAQLEKLYEAVREVLKEAIALGGSSISDYVDADGAWPKWFPGERPATGHLGTT